MSTRRPTYPLDRSPFYRLRTKSRLAKLLGVSPAELRRLAHGGAALYNEWDQPKRNGEHRHIENPAPALKRVQRRIAALLSRVAPPDYLFCPVKKRSYVTNAACHVGAAEVRTLDIKGYFASTPRRRVDWFFRERLECSGDVAAVLARLATVNDHLATGSPLSPILAFFANVDMWEEIGRAVRDAGCVLTVYMDDVTVSGPRVPDGMMWQVRRQVCRCGHRYHKE